MSADALSYLIVRGCTLNQLVENGFVLPENAKRLLQIGQLEIVGFHGIRDPSFCHFNLCLLCVCIAFGDLSSQPQLPWVGKFLRRSDADVGEVAVCVSGKRLRTANAKLLVSEFWIRKCGHLR